MRYLAAVSVLAVAAINIVGIRTAVTLGVPAAPVPVRVAGRVGLVYELHVANGGIRQLRIDRVQVRDAERPNARPVAEFARSEVERNVMLIAPRGAARPATLSPGVRAVVYLWLTFDSTATLPAVLTHHVTFTDGDSVDGAQVTVRAATDLALARGEGVPFVLDAFTVVAHDPDRVAQRAPLTAIGPQRAALPVEGDVIHVAGPHRSREGQPPAPRGYGRESRSHRSVGTVSDRRASGMIQYFVPNGRLLGQS